MIQIKNFFEKSIVCSERKLEYCIHLGLLQYKILRLSQFYFHYYFLSRSQCGSSHYLVEHAIAITTSCDFLQ